MSRWIVRTETSNSCASWLALMRPRVCSSIRMVRRRLANIFRAYHGNMTFGVMLKAVQTASQVLTRLPVTELPDRRRVMQGAALLAAESALNTTTFATENPMTDDPASHDFDFLFGAWKVRHRYLRGRLVGSNDWIEFDGTLRAAPLLGGTGNYDDNTLEKPEGFYRAVTLRAFDPATKSWAIWFLDGRWPHTIGMP